MTRNKLQLTKVFVFASVIVFSLSGKALTEVYKGQSEINTEDSGHAVCTLTLEREDKTASILSLKIEAPAHVIRQEVGEDDTAEDITPGKDSLNLNRSKKFSEFHFQRLADLQGEGYMLHGEKIQKSKKDEKLFLHFDVQDHMLVGVEYEQRESRPSSKGKTGAIERVSLEKICSNLKKL